jgi:EPS-associated MarR family transcriptional regulator
LNGVARQSARPLVRGSAGQTRFARAAVAMEQPTDPFPAESAARRERLDFELLYLLEKEPGLSQRELADRLDISLGKVNYCVKLLIEKGAIKLGNFRASRDKLGYVYVLTPEGISRRLGMTKRFLARKLRDYERLKAQIDALEQDIADRHDHG